jgi:DNA-binding MarR family transcriptional regulator
MTARTVDKAERNETQLGVIQLALRLLDPFFGFKATMPARCIQAFLLVAEKEGLSVGEYAKRAGISATTMSRNLLDISERDRNYEEGPALVVGKENVLNRREKLYSLTPKGRALLASITMSPEERKRRHEKGSH